MSYSGAPYNFIPLNEIVLKSNANNNHSIYDNDKHTGEIKYNVEALTPLFIRGDEKTFFGINGKPMIPASTFRGMIRTIVEVLSYSKMEFIEKEKRLYYRNVARGEDDYRDRIQNGTRRAGWVRIKNKKVELCDANSIDGDYNYLFATGSFDRNQWTYNGNQYKVGTFHDATFDNRDKRDDEVRRLDFNDDDNSKKIKCSLYVTGKFNRKKIQYVIGRPKLDNIIDVTEAYKIYCDDDNRNISYSITNRLKSRDDENDWIPVFYIKENKDIILGDTYCFRLPYRKKVSDFLYDDHLNDDLRDFTNSMFGNLESSTKIFFEDNLFTNGTISHNAEQIDLLNSPKPTSYQHYLTQPGRNLETYNSENAKIRGYKMYWHRNGANYLADNRKYSQNSSPYPTAIKKIEKGSTFEGKIRFENLTQEELGLLLISLQLTDKCAHQVGLGKPFGLGSIKIKDLSLQLTDRRKRYESIALANNWNEGVSLVNNDESENIKMAFINHLALSLKIRIGSTSEFWTQIPRIKELAAMLTFKDYSADWNEKTRYMEIERIQKDRQGRPMTREGRTLKVNEYKEKPILKSPTETAR